MTTKMTTSDPAAQQPKQGSSVRDTVVTPQGGDKVCPEGAIGTETCTTPDDPADPTLPSDAEAA